MRSPKWQRDEIILALDLYFNPYRGSIDSRNPLVIELSDLLNRLPIVNNKGNYERFRNPNGVTLKLSNFLSIDPTYSGKGMSGASKLDKEVFFEYHKNRQKLVAVAKAIKSIVTHTELNTQLIQVEIDEPILLDSVHEGQVLYKLHKYRERDPKIAKAKKTLS